MAVIRPGAAKTFGRTNFVFLTTALDIQAIKLSEATAAGSLDMTGYFFDDTGKPGQSTNRVTRKRRVYDTVTYEQIGVTQLTGGEFSYAVDPQAAALSNGKKALEKLPEGTTGILLRRANVPADTAFAVGQFYSAWPIEVGPQLEGDAGDGETSESSITQTFAITGPAALIKDIKTG